jgi:DNA-binding phage protein
MPCWQANRRWDARFCATIGFPVLAEKAGIHVKTLHQMFGPKGNPTAANLFNIIACLQEHEGVRLQVVA